MNAPFPIWHVTNQQPTRHYLNDWTCCLHIIKEELKQPPEFTKFSMGSKSPKVLESYWKSNQLIIALEQPKVKTTTYGLKSGGYTAAKIRHALPD